MNRLTPGDTFGLKDVNQHAEGAEKAPSWLYKTLVVPAKAPGKVDTFLNAFEVVEVVSMTSLPGDQIAVIIRYDPGTKRNS